MGVLFQQTRSLHIPRPRLRRSDHYHQGTEDKMESISQDPIHELMVYWEKKTVQELGGMFLSTSKSSLSPLAKILESMVIGFVGPAVHWAHVFLVCFMVLWFDFWQASPASAWLRPIGMPICTCTMWSMGSQTSVLMKPNVFGFPNINIKNNPNVLLPLVHFYFSFMKMFPIRYTENSEQAADGTEVKMRAVSRDSNIGMQIEPSQSQSW